MRYIGVCIIIAFAVFWFGFLGYFINQDSNKKEMERLELQIKKEQLKQLRLENLNKMLELDIEGVTDDVLRESN